MRRFAALLLCAGFAAAPLYGQEFAPVRVGAPAYSAGAALAGAQAMLRLGSLQPSGLGNFASPNISALPAPPALYPSVIPTALAPQAVQQAEAGAPSVQGQISESPGASGILQAPGYKNGPLSAMDAAKGLVAGMAKAPGLPADISGRFFDQSGVAKGSGLDETSARVVPQAPAGVKSVSVDIVRQASDVERLIPDPWNSHNPSVQEYLTNLRQELKAGIKDMAPYPVYTYHDYRGKRFVGIDLAANPALVEKVPELEPHEIRLIKKLQLVNSDIRVLVREDGKTPDLVMGDMLTELKSRRGHDETFALALNKANTQVFKHARYHGLGNGAAVIEFNEEKSVLVDKVLKEIENWRRVPAGGNLPRVAGAAWVEADKLRKDPVALDKIYIFAAAEYKVFVRQADGSFRLEGPAAVVVGQDRPVKPAELPLVKSLLKEGRLQDAVLAAKP